MEYQDKQPLGYGDQFSFAGNQMMQSFDPQHELFGLQAGMEMLGIPSTSKDVQNPNPNPWQVDDSSLLCLLPQERSPQPTSQGLALSLYNPGNSDQRDGFLSVAPNPHHHDLHQHQQQQQLFLEDGRFFQQEKGCKYLIPAQQLLNELCNLGADGSPKPRAKKPSQWEEGGPSSSSSSSWNQSLLQLQKRKAKLLSMLEEVDRRYRKYCEQMRAVVSSFEAVAGEGAATVYSTLASKAMSRHFRCLRDGIVDQIQAAKKAMGEKDSVALETTRGETPRLKLLDQRLRQQKAFQQAGMLEGHPWRPQRGLPDRAVSVLRAWLFEHFLHPYPSDIDKHILARQTGLSRSQVSNWFINARVRLWKPMVEEMYVEELKEKDHQGSSNQNPNPNLYSLEAENRKPALGQLTTDSDSLASIINSARQPSSRDQKVLRSDGFGAINLDFSSYNNFGNLKFGNDVSLTLGLQQHRGSGMTLSFSPANQYSLLTTEQMDGGQPTQFSIVDGNLVGDQLMHDFGG